MSETTTIEPTDRKRVENERLLKVLIDARDGKAFFPSGPSERQFIESLRRAGKLNDRIKELQKEIGITDTPAAKLTKKEVEKQAKALKKEEEKQRKSYWKKAGPGKTLGTSGGTRKRRRNRKVTRRR